MNFKDIYKEANDEIKGDREILKSVLDGSFTPKKKKSPVKIVYAFGSLAAAAAILFAVFFVLIRQTGLREVGNPAILFFHI